jgi:hypothetical protein
MAMESSETPAPMPLGARLVNVFAAPGEVFSSVARAPFMASNWLVPAIIVGLIGLIVNLVIFTNPALVQQIQDIQEKEFQKAVDRGRMTEEQVEHAREAMLGIGMTIARVASAVGGVIYGFLAPLWWGLLAWLTGRWILRGTLPYMRAVEVAGLSSLIAALGMLVGMFMAVGTGQLMSGPHFGLLVKGFDMSNRGHLALAAVNVFSLWQLAVIALGISRLIGRAFGQVLLVLGLIWAGYKAIAVAFRLVQFAL